MKVAQHVIERDAAMTLRECPYIELDVQRRKITALMEHIEHLQAVLRKAEIDNMNYHATLQQLRNTLRYRAHKVPPEKDNNEALQEVQELLNITSTTQLSVPKHKEVWSGKLSMPERILLANIC